MFGTKIRSWMEAHIARSRAKKKDRASKAQILANAQPTLQTTAQLWTDEGCVFEPKFFGARADFNEILPGLPISPTTFRSARVDPRHRQQQQQQQQPDQRQLQPRYAGGAGGKAAQVVGGNSSAVNLSSPESAYSTGYSTDGTSPCATYAPEYYINVARATPGQHGCVVQQRPGVSQVKVPASQQLDTSTQTRGRSRIDGGRGRDRAKEDCRENDRVENTGTYSVSATRSRFLESKEYEHHPWRKPAPPTTSRPLASSPKIQSGHLVRKPYSTPVVTDCASGAPSPVPSNYPPQLFSPRRMPLVATTTTQVMLIKSPRQRSRVRTNPWPGAARSNGTAPMVVQLGGGACGRPWSRQQPYNNTLDYCCRQESLSVGRSPVNRSDWRSSAQLRQQQRQQQLRKNSTGSSGRNNQRRSSSASSCSSRSSRSCSRSRSCSISSSSNSCSRSRSRSRSNSIEASSPSSDDITLNELMGKFDENYLYDKETDIVSEHGCTTGVDVDVDVDICLDGTGSNCTGSSANFSSDASASSLDLNTAPNVGSRSSSRSTSRHRQQRGVLSGRRHRRRGHKRSLEAGGGAAAAGDEEEKEHREEVELLQEVINRRFKRSSDEASAQANRALLERLLMKNASVGGGGGRRAWSASPASASRAAAASRSVGGTPICLRRRPATRAPGGHQVPLAPSARLAFDRNHHQVYPAGSTSSLKNISASELALLEADKEADLKYAQLIMEAERMLLNVQQQLQREESASNSRRGSAASVAADNSPSRFPRMLYQQQQQQQQQQSSCTASAPNKRVELIKNAELNIELALLKSRNSQPELSSGSIKDLLDHSSPKRLLQQQQKKIIEPVVSQTVASTQTAENNLTSFQSIDVNPAAMLRAAATAAHQGNSAELSSTSEHYACPQSAPVKRKVYEEQLQQEAGGLLQHQAPPWLRNSDGDCAAAEQQQQQPQLQASASAASSYSQLRKHMLIETLQGLKQSLEDQSAALKLSCLRPV